MVVSLLCYVNFLLYRPWFNWNFNLFLLIFLLSHFSDFLNSSLFLQSHPFGFKISCSLDHVFLHQIFFKNENISGSAADMIENANSRSIELQRKSDCAKSFLKQNKITGELEERIKQYLDYLWISPDVNEDEVLESLPANLKKEIAMNVHIETLKRVKIFQDCEPGLLEELVTKLKLQIYSPGDYVCRKGDVGHEVIRDFFSIFN